LRQEKFDQILEVIWIPVPGDIFNIKSKLLQRRHLANTTETSLSNILHVNTIIFDDFSGDPDINYLLNIAKYGIVTGALLSLKGCL